MFTSLKKKIFIFLIAALAMHVINAMPKKKSTGGKFFACEAADCGKFFNSKKGLNQHLNLHTGNIACDICGKWYSCHSSRKLHMAKKHGVYPYKCFSCGERFEYKKDLGAHACDEPVEHEKRKRLSGKFKKKKKRKLDETTKVVDPIAGEESELEDVPNLLCKEKIDDISDKCRATHWFEIKCFDAVSAIVTHSFLDSFKEEVIEEGFVKAEEFQHYEFDNWEVYRKNKDGSYEYVDRFGGTCRVWDIPPRTTFD